MKICPVGAELFHVDGQTGMTKLIVAFCNFANVPKKCWSSYWQAWQLFTRPGQATHHVVGEVALGQVFLQVPLTVVSIWAMLCVKFHLYTIGIYVMIFAVDCSIKYNTALCHAVEMDDTETCQHWKLCARKF